MEYGWPSSASDLGMSMICSQRIFVYGLDGGKHLQDCPASAVFV